MPYTTFSQVAKVNVDIKNLNIKVSTNFVIIGSITDPWRALEAVVVEWWQGEDVQMILEVSQRGRKWARLQRYARQKSVCIICCYTSEGGFSPKVQGRFEPLVKVIMLSPGVSGASHHPGFASESSLHSSRFLLDPNILSGQCIPSGENSGSVHPLAQFVLTAYFVHVHYTVVQKVHKQSTFR